MVFFKSIPELLANQARSRSQSPAISGVGGATVTYGALDAETKRLAGVMRNHGIEPSGRIAIVLPNGPEMALTFLTVTRVATAAPLNPGLTHAEFAYYLEDLGARGVVVWREDTTKCTGAARALGIPLILAGPSTSGDGGGLSFQFETGNGTPVDSGAEGGGTESRAGDVALVLHTSGTTARPKIVPLTHENLCRSGANVAKALGLGPEDRCLNVMPLFHIHGLVAALLGSLCSGASVVCTSGYHAPSFFGWMEHIDPTWYTAVPTMHQGILSRAGPRDKELVRKGRLRLIRSSSASLPPKILRDMEEAFRVPVIEAYGMTEAAHQMTSNPLPPLIRKAGSVGTAAGPEVAIADTAGRFLAQGEVGEVVIRGPNVTRGYHGAGDSGRYFFGDGWFRTGDQGYLDPEGYLFLTGRLKEIINRGGESIAPRQIDEALLELASVEQAVAFSVPDPALGEEVAAAVVLADGATATESDLQNQVMRRLSWARTPKRILIVDELPKGPTGKLQRIGLAKRLGLQSIERERGPETKGTEEGREVDKSIVESLSALWKDVLKIAEVGLDQTFAEAGGDSVTATLLLLGVEETFGVKVPLLTFFDAATIRRQAVVIQDLMKDAPGPRLD